jgi:hypothetical protein
VLGVLLVYLLRSQANLQRKEKHKEKDKEGACSSPLKDKEQHVKVRNLWVISSNNKKKLG